MVSILICYGHIEVTCDYNIMYDIMDILRHSQYQMTYDSTQLLRKFIVKSDKATLYDIIVDLIFKYSASIVS